MFEQLDNCFTFCSHRVALAWNIKLWVMPQIENSEEIEFYPRISYTKSIQQMNLVKQNRLLGKTWVLPRSAIQETL